MSHFATYKFEPNINHMNNIYMIQSNTNKIGPKAQRAISFGIKVNSRPVPSCNREHNTSHSATHTPITWPLRTKLV